MAIILVIKLGFRKDWKVQKIPLKLKIKLKKIPKKLK